MSVVSYEFETDASGTFEIKVRSRSISAFLNRRVEVGKRRVVLFQTTSNKLLWKYADTNQVLTQDKQKLATESKAEYAKDCRAHRIRYRK